ncbi:MAG: beta-galactosidase [Ilumatobacteraceae bacterium]
MADPAVWRPASMVFGADYNPEQWDESVWAEDLTLMQEAGVNLVSLAIFSWALLEPEPGVFEFGWLDRAIEGLHGAGVGVNLANATASPPPWLAARHPETLPMTIDGKTLWPGGRQAYCPSSPIFRERAGIVTEQIAARYTGHPTLKMWHVSNEMGCHVSHCYCNVSAAAFRVWLETKYGTLDALNFAWGTNFWSQRYHAWDEINPPRIAPTFPNPTQQLDFRRFSSDELLATYRAEREVLQRITPGVPITTNLVTTHHFGAVDYWAWAEHLDVVASDHYLNSADPHAHLELAFVADLSRGLAGGEPWLIMEHSTSAVNWQPRNRAKQPGEMIRNSLQHVARGSDGAMFFQWRASTAGAEKYHSALVPHAGTDTKVWRDVMTLGRSLAGLDAVVGSTVEASVAIVFDWQCWWNTDLDSRPTRSVRYIDQSRAMYRALWEAGVTADFVPPGGSLDEYRLVIVPTLTMVDDAAVGVLERYVEGGGTVLMTYFSGIVDEHDHIRLGGYPGAFRSMLGIWTEEFFPLDGDETVQLDDGSRATLWTELTHLAGAEAVASYTDGPVAGGPAITRYRFGDGTAWYLGTRLDQPDLAALVTRITRECGVVPAVEGLPTGVEAVRRVGDAGSWLFVINHTDADAEVRVEGVNLLTGQQGTSHQVTPGGVAVITESSLCLPQLRLPQRYALRTADADAAIGRCRSLRRRRGPRRGYRGA